MILNQPKIKSAYPYIDMHNFCTDYRHTQIKKQKGTGTERHKYTESVLKKKHRPRQTQRTESVLTA